MSDNILDSETGYFDHYSNIPILYKHILLGTHKIKKFSDIIIVYIRKNENCDNFLVDFYTNKISGLNIDDYNFKIIGKNLLLFCPYCNGIPIYQKVISSDVSTIEEIKCLNCGANITGLNVRKRWNSRIYFDIMRNYEMKRMNCLNNLFILYCIIVTIISISTVYWKFC